MLERVIGMGDETARLWRKQHQRGWIAGCLHYSDATVGPTERKAAPTGVRHVEQRVEGSVKARLSQHSSDHKACAEAAAAAAAVGARCELRQEVSHHCNAACVDPRQRRDLSGVPQEDAACICSCGSAELQDYAVEAARRLKLGSLAKQRGAAGLAQPTDRDGGADLFTSPPTAAAAAAAQQCAITVEFIAQLKRKQLIVANCCALGHAMQLLQHCRRPAFEESGAGTSLRRSEEACDESCRPGRHCRIAVALLADSETHEKLTAPKRQHASNFVAQLLP
jgi:hypothetical protein